MVKFRYRLLSPRRNSPPVLQNRRLGQPQNWSGLYGEYINFLPLLGIKPIVGVLGYEVRSISTPLSTLSDCHAGVIGKTSHWNVFESKFVNQTKARMFCATHFFQVSRQFNRSERILQSRYAVRLFPCFCILSAGLG
jgi:hypothetical protein